MRYFVFLCSAQGTARISKIQWLGGAEGALCHEAGHEVAATLLVDSLSGDSRENPADVALP